MWFLVLGKVLPREFYERNPENVAKELLGKRLIRKLDASFLEGIIVETEAYYGLNDPASRAFNGIKNTIFPELKIRVAVLGLFNLKTSPGNCSGRYSTPG